MIPIPLVILGLGTAALFLLRKKDDGIEPSVLPKATTDMLNAAIQSPTFANLTAAHALLIQTANLGEPQARQAFDMLANLANQTKPRIDDVPPGFSQQLVSLFSDGTEMVDVFMASGPKLFRYRFNVSTGARQLVTKTDGAPDSAVNAAMAALQIGARPGEVQTS